MVPPVSRGISRGPRYSGAGTPASCLSPTGLLPSMADLSRSLRLDSALGARRGNASHPVPQPPCSNDCRLTLQKFGLFPFRSPLLRESIFLSFPRGTKMFQFPRFPPRRLCIQRPVARVCRAGLPHSEIHGSRPACGSPWLIAASCVLHRLLAPRHPPYALTCLIQIVKPMCSYQGSPAGLGLVEMSGIEPLTSCLQSRRSPN